MALIQAGCDCEGVMTVTDTGMSGDSGTLEDTGSRPDTGARPDSGADTSMMIACGALMCGPGERCEMDPARCVENTCADLACAATERCEPAPTGPGNVCVDNSCSDSVECADAEHCARGICIADVCTPGTATCTASGAIEECVADGSGATERFTCGSAAYFSSMCTEDPSGAYCPCRDDWDCPRYTVCNAGVCEGTGRAPTCRLPPAPFTDVLPTMEAGFPWGGVDRSDRDAVGSPFPSSSQVVMTPLIANLDDDNGDGLIDERDFPEIIFMTFCGSSFTSNGILRAVHGGGPNRGADFFATCGSTEWHEGDDPSAITCACSDATLDPTATAAVADLDGDGVPEIVAATENNRAQIFTNRGEPLGQSTWSVPSGNQSVAIANVDGVGNAEVIIGREIYNVEADAMGVLQFVDRWAGTLAQGSNNQGPIPCVADLDSDGRAELIAGSSVYRFPRAPAGGRDTGRLRGR